MTIETQAQNIAAIKDYLIELSFQDIAPSTTAKYKQCLRDFLRWLEGRPVSAQAAKMFLAELKERGYKPRSVQLYYHAIKPFLEFQGIPFKLRFKKTRQLPQYHSPNELNSILAVIGNRGDTWAKLGQRDSLIVLMLAFTGLRASELVNLRPCDITSGYVFVRHGKGDKDRTIPLAQSIQQPLRDYIESENPKPTNKLFPIQRRRLYTIVKQYATAAGINDLSPHGLRHYFATRLVEQGAQIKAVQELLGHANISTTAIYLDLVPGHLQSSIALLDESSSISTNKNISNSIKRSRSKSLSLSLSSEQGREKPLCGSNSKKARPSMQLSTLTQSKVSPSIGQDNGVNYALARDAPIASQEIPSGGDTRPSLSLTEPQRIGSLERSP